MDSGVAPVRAAEKRHARRACCRCRRRLGQLRQLWRIVSVTSRSGGPWRITAAAAWTALSAVLLPDACRVTHSRSAEPHRRRAIEWGAFAVQGYRRFVSVPANRPRLDSQVRGACPPARRPAKPADIDRL